MFPARRSRFIAWTAALAVMLAVLAPALTHGFSWVGGTQMKWVEVCTAAGVTMLAQDDGGDPVSSGDGVPWADHCPYCSPYAGSFALPPADLPALWVDAGGESLPPVFFEARRPSLAWGDARPRAPPRAG